MPKTTRRPLIQGLASAAVAALFALPGATPSLAEDATAVSPAKVSIDFDESRGKLFRCERYNNFSHEGSFAAQRPADVKFFNEQGLHGRIYRVWVWDQGYNPETNTFDVSQLASYLRDASQISDWILVNLQPGRLMGAGAPPEQLKPQLKTVIKTLKQKYPQIRYIEAFNEPDHDFAKTLKPEQLYSYYVPFYEAVNEVNEELEPEVTLEVGGPALMEWHPSWMNPFLDAYKADPSPNKRLDFISYHAYGYFASLNPRVYHFYKGDPSEVAGQRDLLDAELRRRGLDVNIQTYLTEAGIYPGPSFDEKDGYADYLRQAAGMASLSYWYMEDPKNVPFNWVVRHHVEGRKDQLVTRIGEGKIPPTGKFTPYGNMLHMMSKLKATRVAARSDALDAGKGVYALAAKDATGASVMVWNYQHTKTARFRAQVDLSNLPADLRNRPVRERIFRIDQATSNYFADPERANLQQVADKTITPGAGYTETLELEPNALQLILLEPE